MPEQELLDDFLEALEAAGSPVRNPVLRETLGWPEPRRSGKMTPLPPIKRETQ
jgi:hypothetical protein